MKTTLAILLCSLHAIAAIAATSGVNEACKQLCDQEAACLKKCVGHAELFEIRPELIKSVAAFDPDTETRLKVLRTGASAETLELCKKADWSLENTLICLRSYPTRDLMKACTKAKRGEDEQVECVRSGVVPYTPPSR